MLRANRNAPVTRHGPRYVGRMSNLTLPAALGDLAIRRATLEAAQAAVEQAEAVALRAALEAAAWRQAAAARLLGLSSPGVEGDDPPARVRLHRMLARHPEIRRELDRRTSPAYSASHPSANGA